MKSDGVLTRACGFVILVFSCSVNNCFSGFTEEVPKSPGSDDFATRNDLSNIQKTETCNGILSAPVGVITYKLGIEYNEHERCIWTVQAGLYKNIRIRLISNGLAGNYMADAISIYTITPTAAFGVDKLTKAGALDNRTTDITVPGPLAYLFFHTDGSSHGTGFSLIYEGVGDEYNSTYYCFELVQQDPVTEPTGVTQYMKNNANCYRKIYSLVFPVKYMPLFRISIENFSAGIAHVSYNSNREISVYLLQTYQCLLRARYGNADAGSFTSSSAYPFVVLFVTNMINETQSFTIRWGRN